MKPVSKKKCLHCEKTKSVAEFYRMHGCKDGLRPTCKSCVSSEQKAWRKRNRAALKIAKRRYYDENKQAIIDKVIRWRRDNIDRAHAREAEWRKKNKERIKERHLRYLARNPERVLELSRERAKRYYARNKEAALTVIRANMKKRKALYKQSGLASAIKHLLSEAERCAYCSRIGKMEMDHKTPLSRGGKHALKNLAAVCKDCNARKHTMTVPEFRRYAARVGYAITI